MKFFAALIVEITSVESHVFFCFCLCWELNTHTYRIKCQIIPPAELWVIYLVSYTPLIQIQCGLQSCQPQPGKYLRVINTVSWENICSFLEQPEDSGKASFPTRESEEVTILIRPHWAEQHKQFHLHRTSTRFKIERSAAAVVAE